MRFICPAWPGLGGSTGLNQVIFGNKFNQDSGIELRKEAVKRAKTLMEEEVKECH